jgi:integrase
MELKHKMSRQVLKKIGQATEKKAQFDVNTALNELEKYMRYEKRYSDYNVLRTMDRARLLFARYSITLPSVDDAIRIEEDLKAKNHGSINITHYLITLELISESMGFPLKLQKPKKVYKKRDSLTHAEALSMLNSCQYVRDRAIVAVLLYCGLRNKELCGLNVEDIDTRNKILYVRDRGNGIKNRHERTAVLTNDCISILNNWLKDRPQLPNPALFVTHDGNRLRSERLDRIIRDVAKSAGIKKRVFPHLLRHTCATMMLKSGIPITEVALQLGHRDLSSTMIYLHGDIEGLKASIDKKFTY